MALCVLSRDNLLPCSCICADLFLTVYDIWHHEMNVIGFLIYTGNLEFRLVCLCRFLYKLIVLDLDEHEPYRCAFLKQVNHIIFLQPS